MKHKKVRFVLFIILSLFMLSGNLWAEEAPKLDTGDTAFFSYCLYKALHF